MSAFGGRVYGAEPARRAFERTGPTPSAGSKFMRSKRDAMAKIHLEAVLGVERRETSGDCAEDEGALWPTGGNGRDRHSYDAVTLI